MKHQKEDGRAHRGDQARQKILEAALDVMGSEGAENFSASQLAKKAGMAKSNLFHHFASIDLIPLRALEMLLTRITESLIGKEHESAQALVYDMGKSLVELTAKRPKLLKSLFFFYQKALHHPKYKQAMAQLMRSFASSIASRIEKLNGSKIGPEKAKDLALLLAFTLDGTGYYGLILEDKKELLRSWQLLSVLVARHLGEEGTRHGH